MPILEVVENFLKLSLPTMCVGPLGINKKMHPQARKTKDYYYRFLF
jgi:hypothetical protein